MSDTDSFIDEVTEEVRRDRLFGYFRRYGWIPAVIILALVGGTAYSEWSKSVVAQAAQVRGDALLDALDVQGKPESISALSSIVAQEDGDVVASFLVAGLDQSLASELLTAIAENMEQPKYIRDLALLKLAATLDAASKDEAVSILTDLSAPGGVYRNAAMEILVALELQRGNRDVALLLLQSHVQDAGTTQAQVQRMGELIVALGAIPDLGN
ncbi:MAG: hypothetical protein OSB16_07100 [Planktomarina sp.]|jgi:hypothetical protein|nr:hypothetical protein [Planktomarina sp.]MDT2072300.1 hypothetical protein [Planktomarina sp.]MDT2078593.1 hypothetical protein [Planktomarina sp.]|tara:strand:- start:4389 stop:5027 length:639 start_codon:yes stop_codon:yes gene_type:complete